ncbi:6-hydroxymethylpterin diphosphokinase MptE-like protein [Thalassolituus oleivorans]|uniref:motility associated factor glycosyltransferase family protein n=1 Tax=Thalassolituus oleivorans TaxID=187493 RepID=UPI0023F558F7|nr:6-hydroxymethylpterin diphosphokinase MptE-like protein [Thalassolituus oleivorans]
MAQTRAQNAEELKNRNLAYFKKFHPAIYAKIADLEFKHLTLNIDGATDKIDLSDGTTSLYAGDAEAFADKEINEFQQHYSAGNKIRTLRPPQRGEVAFHRFFSKRLNALINNAPASTDFSDVFTLPDFYPFILFMGCGVGLHIEKMLAENNILNVVIFEPDSEYLYASLYIVNWHELFNTQLNAGRRIELIIGSNQSTQDEDNAVVWNMLINYCPSFPLTAVFFAHGKSERYAPIVSHIKNDIHFYLNQWGYYDDEINQLNNGFHNVASGIQPFKPKDINTDIPTVIVGGGPSLDLRIDEIKRFRDKILLISCGTAVHSLLSEDIVPDIHVEIESHMLTYESLSKSTQTDFFEKTLLIGALQLPPNVFKLFKNKVYFIKDSTALAYLFAQPEDIIHRATPTCTNTGIAIATHMNMKNMFLYGMDFGFPERDKHHSKSSIYYSDTMSNSIKESVKRNFRDLVKVESVTGESIYSIPMYCTSRRSAEMCMIMRSYSEGLASRNCSEGAKIEGAEHCPKDELINILNDFNSAKIDELIDNLKGEAYSQTEVRAQIDKLGDILQTITRELSIYLKQLNSSSLLSLFQLSHAMNRHMLERLHPKYGALVYILRGSIWHFLNTGTALALSTPEGKDRETFIEDWARTFNDFLKDVTTHYRSITSKEYPDDSDPWIREDIVSNEKYYAE